MWRYVYLGIVALTVPSIARAAPEDALRALTLPAQPLSSSVQSIAKRYGIQLLFSQSVIGERWAPSVSGRMTVEQAFALVLAGSPLAVRKTGEGSFIITAMSVGSSEQPKAIPDILVIGQRTQNTDVRRTENDVRPYQVITRQDIAASHVSTIEELAGKRFPANDQGATLSQQGAGAQGSTASSINLRGLGTDQTLILVDGHRLPMMPGPVNGFNQSDVNAIPLEAIERVEAITATAGGIYGPGATAGVVNLVLRRDYRGIDVAVTDGVTARGDTPTRRVDLRLGFTPDHGSTDVMVEYARSTFGGLDVGDRDYQKRANARIFANDPGYFVLAGPPPSASLTVVASGGDVLRLKSAFGGATLGSQITFVPPADGRSSAELVQVLIENAGRIDPNPSPDASGDSQTLLSGRRTTAFIASARHRLGPIELFVDYLHFDNEGTAQTGYPQNAIKLSADDPGNPFDQAVTVYAPQPSQTIRYAFSSRVSRLTGGVIVQLPGAWRAEGDYSHGSGISSYVSRGQQLTLAGINAYYGGNIGNPLGDYSAYLQSFAGLFGDYGETSHARNVFGDASLRLAGPVLSLSGGDLSATLLAERRSERVANASRHSYSPLLSDEIVEARPNYGQVTSSLYGEVRAPLVDALSGFRPLRGLEVQLAMRRDWTTTDAIQNALSVDGGGTRTVRNTGTVYTAGLKFSPIEGLLLRGSISTGQQPLTVSNLSRYILPGLTFNDPKRPGTFEFFDEVSGGAPNPRPGRAQSLSAGIVFQPQGVPNLRVSVDFTHIEKRGEDVVTLANGSAYFIANEQDYPDRVVRQPLTSADAALGYTGGLITSVDSSSLQNGRTVTDSVDGLMDFSFSLNGAGIIAVHAATAWQPRFRRIIGFGLPSRNYVGVTDGAPAFRGNAGARFTAGPLTLSADAQLTGRYRITSALEFLQDIDERYAVVHQGGADIAAQARFDLAVEYRVSIADGGLAGRPRAMSIRFGVQDAFDTRPKTVVNASGAYNTYLDPRRRRFDLTVAANL
ncbi:TonB-dependent receptor [Sphingomonas sp. NFR15]|uniref:TonB-dependent receptor n=1 Tax=Sphingomonas sp. NFR15 TaxID=1566282 RepID=UPI00088637B8|nr:TonB-dependent receptor [Sphingomonas sp. NFR15]SDA11597.1 TonB dependent receptor [Sphingomonas sp. NFR15]